MVARWKHYIALRDELAALNAALAARDEVQLKSLETEAVVNEKVSMITTAEQTMQTAKVAMTEAEQQMKAHQAKMTELEQQKTAEEQMLAKVEQAHADDQDGSDTGSGGSHSAPG